MQLPVPWNSESGVPRIPVGYSQGWSQTYAGSDALCPHCGSNWGTQALLQSHIQAVHHLTHNLANIREDDSENAFLLDDCEDEGDGASVSEPEHHNGPPETSPCPNNTIAPQESESHSDPIPFPGYPCAHCPDVTFQTERELEVHTCVIHSVELLSQTKPVTVVHEGDLNVVDATAPSVGVPPGFRRCPVVPDVEPSSQSKPEAMDENACQLCAHHKRPHVLPSQEDLYLHIQQAHLRCPAAMVGSPCDLSLPSADLLSKHLQAAHRLCPHCTHPAFRQHAAAHRHIQLKHRRCSYCTKGLYASPKALADHIRAAHTSQHLRTGPKVLPSAAVPQPPTSLKLGALHYVMDSDGLEYLATITQLPKDGQVLVQWVGSDCECSVASTALRAEVELIKGTFVQVDLGGEWQEFVQGEIINVEDTAQISLRLLASNVTYGIRLEHILDVIPLRQRLHCSFLGDDEEPQEGDIVSVDFPSRRCTIRCSALNGAAIAGVMQDINFDRLIRLTDLRKGYHCAVVPHVGEEYEAQILDVAWAQGLCKVYRDDLQEEATVAMTSVKEVWRSDHILDEKTVVPRTPISTPSSTVATSPGPAPEPNSEVAVYKPAMRFPAVVPDDKQTDQKDRKKKSEPSKEAPVPAQAPPLALAAVTAKAGNAYFTPAAPAASSPGTTTAWSSGGYEYLPYPSASYAAGSFLYPQQGYNAPGYMLGYGAYAGYGAFPGAYATSGLYSAGAGANGVPGSGRGEGRRQGKGDGFRSGRGYSRGAKGGRGDETGQPLESPGWALREPHPHRMIVGRPYPVAVFEMALRESQNTPPVLPPPVPPLPLLPHAEVLGTWALKVAKAMAPAKDHVAYREELRVFFEGVLRHHLENFHLELYVLGSAATGLLHTASELDLCLVWDQLYNCTLPLSKVKGLLRQAATALKTEGVPGNVTPMLEERFPFVKGTGGDLNFEISMSAYCAVRNSALVRQYVLRYPMVRPLLLVLLAWAKRWRLHGRKVGLSTYTLTLMVLHFLVRSGEIQLIGIEEQLPINKEACPFLPFVDVDASKLGGHLVGFFYFYTSVFDFSKHVVTIRTPYVVSRESKQWMAEPLAVEDPYETMLNTASNVATAQWAGIRHAMDSAYRLLRVGKLDEFWPTGTGALSPVYPKPYNHSGAIPAYGNGRANPAASYTSAAAVYGAYASAGSYYPYAMGYPPTSSPSGQPAPFYPVAGYPYSLDYGMVPEAVPHPGYSGNGVHPGAAWQASASSTASKPHHNFSKPSS